MYEETSENSKKKFNTQFSQLRTYIHNTLQI